MDEFDALLLSAIDETLTYVLGNVNAKIIFDYLESKSCPRQEIPKRIVFFCETLQNLLGTGRGQILGAAIVLEETIAEAFALKLGKKFNESRPIYLAKYIDKLKQKE